MKCAGCVDGARGPVTVPLGGMPPSKAKEVCSILGEMKLL